MFTLEKRKCARDRPLESSSFRDALMVGFMGLICTHFFLPKAARLEGSPTSQMTVAEGLLEGRILPSLRDSVNIGGVICPNDGGTADIRWATVSDATWPATWKTVVGLQTSSRTIHVSGKPTYDYLSLTLSLYKHKVFLHGFNIHTIFQKCNHSPGRIVFCFIRKLADDYLLVWKIMCYPWDLHQ